MKFTVEQHRVWIVDDYLKKIERMCLNFYEFIIIWAPINSSSTLPTFLRSMAMINERREHKKYLNEEAT